MGFLESLWDSTGGAVTGWFTDAIQAGLDSLGLSSHGRDQYFARDLQREMLERQIGAQQEENQKNRDFSKEMLIDNYNQLFKNYPFLLKMQNDASFNNWFRQFQEQTKYNESVNSPQAQVRRMMQAGLNPNQGVTSTVANNMGANSLGVPPTIQGSPLGGSVSPVGLPQGLGSHGQQLSEIGSFLRDVAQARKLGKETNWYDKFMEVNLDNMQSEANRNKVLSAYQELQTSILKAYGHQKAAAEVVKLNNEGIVLLQQGNYYEAQSKLAKAQEILSKSENEKIQKEMPFLTEKYQLINDGLEADKELSIEKKKTEKSEQSKNYSIANLNNALSKTENDLREGKVYGQSLSNDLSYIQKEIGSIDVLIADSTWQYKVVELAQRAEQAQLITKQELERLEQLQVQTDWASRQEFAKYCKVFIDGITGAINSYANVKGALNGQQRNDIRQQTVDYMRDHEHEVHETVTTNGHDSRGNKVTHTVSRYRAPWQQ